MTLKLDLSDYQKIRNLARLGIPAPQIAERFQVTPEHVREILRQPCMWPRQRRAGTTNTVQGPAASPAPPGNAGGRS